jgi:hypothetical protein
MISKVSVSRGVRILTGLLAAGMVCMAASGATPDATPFKPGKVPPANQPDISGVWMVTNYSPYGKTIDGKDPPLQKWARAIADQRLATAAKGHPYPDSETFCFTPAMPRIMFGPGYPVQILQTAGQVTMLFEILHNVRFIYLTDKHSSLDDIDPSYHGESIGHWEKDTLVVDTIGMTDKSTIDKYGTPHSDALHVIERIRLTNKDALEDVVTMEDPKAFTAPWIYRATYARQAADMRLQEYFCENNRNPVDKNGNVIFEGTK